MLASNLIATDEAKEAAIKYLEQRFELTTDQLKHVSSLLLSEMKTGLKKCDQDCNVPMLPCWITSHPTGQETGEYIGLDLSGKRTLILYVFILADTDCLIGSYVRVYLVTLHGQGRITTRQLKYTVRDNIKRGHISGLIDFMAECVDSFLIFVNKTNPKTPLSLGLCISFPLHQTAINNAYVLQWTKDFEITGAERKNIVELLQTSFRRREIPVIVKAAVNGAGM